ncbi:hypothetical protein [Haploplasma axanthum]|uniref:Uncharacterized protein n=1 Tax=Haploplasma axanthum TaxID=29552 RepID=A0A449BB90_HAPAX|nr:hypothetical protein [Haploplasma axanthum]VEU79599.1 Uncharacterised protein [Haploplasma axanthum]
MKKDKSFKVLVVIVGIVFVLAVVSLLAGDYLAATFDVIGIRIAVLIVSFAAFVASTMFSLMVYLHNKTVSKINDDSNRRAELFRELQFASSNYSIIEFNDRMLIYHESERYIPRFYNDDRPTFHMVQDTLDMEKEVDFYTIRIPFKVIEGKTAGKIKLQKIRFEREGVKFNFIPAYGRTETQGYILYNEQTKRNNLIINLVFNKDSGYFSEEELNKFSKIKIFLSVVSILGVKIKGISELYFTNPTIIEGDGLHTYKINSANFSLTQKPSIEKLEYGDELI